MNNIEKKKIIVSAVIVLLIIVGVAGATYAYSVMRADVTNEAYNIATHCFTIDYNINNVSGGQDITGTLFPSGIANKGLTGRVGFKINSNCDIEGKGTIKLHINGNNATSSTLTSSAASYCENRSTLEPMTGNEAPTTKAECDSTKGRWRSYGDSYCQDADTLERMTEYTNSSTCTSNGGTWVTCTNNNCNVSPLKYAIYDNSTGTGTPLSKGTIESSDIGSEITIYDNFSITKTIDYTYYYIFIWLDGYLTDSSYVNLPFSGYITTEAIPIDYFGPTISSITGSSNGAGSGSIRGIVSASDTSGVASYGWYLSTTATCPTTDVYQTTTTPNCDLTVTDGGTYYVCVKATDTLGNTSYKVSNSVTYIAQTTCPAGEYYNGSTGNCTTCPAGSYCVGWTGTPDSSNHGIEACATGSISTANSSSCTACSAGTTTSGAGQTSCSVTCSNNSNVYAWETPSWSNGTVSNVCTVSTCNANYYKNSNTCSVCSSGTYTSAGNTASSCSNCSGTGVYSWAAAGQGCVAASCSSGYKRSGNGCAECGGGYTSSNGNTSTSCSTCSNNANVSTWSGNGCTISSCAGGYTKKNNACVVASCTVYCTSTSSCSKTQPTSGLYGVFTCNNSTGKTGSISECWYGYRQCDNASGRGPTYLCTLSTSSSSYFAICNPKLSSTRAYGLGLSGSGYSCSC